MTTLSYATWVGRQGVGCPVPSSRGSRILDSAASWPRAWRQSYAPRWTARCCKTKKTGRDEPRQTAAASSSSWWKGRGARRPGRCRPSWSAVASPSRHRSTGRGRRASRRRPSSPRARGHPQARAPRQAAQPARPSREQGAHRVAAGRHEQLRVAAPSPLPSGGGEGSGCARRGRAAGSHGTAARRRYPWRRRRAFARRPLQERAGQKCRDAGEGGGEATVVAHPPTDTHLGSSSRRCGCRQSPSRLSSRPPGRDD